MAVLRLNEVTKRYHHIIAVEGLSFEIGPGELVGFIGPNGAGKSTTMKCIAGLLSADGGTIELGGVDMGKDPVTAKAKIGYVPQDLHLYEYLTGAEFLRFVAEVRQMDPSKAEARMEELFTLLELDHAKDRLVREYSGGMARKLAIAGAVLSDPPLLLLDESFVGLDPESTAAVRRYLTSYCEGGGSVVLSSHVLDMLERMCDRVILIAAGKVRVDLDGEALTAAIAEHGTLADLYLTESAPYRRRPGEQKAS